MVLHLQNYYYLVQDTEWREENDWIHRENDQVQAPLVAFTFCGSRNIRPQTDCLAFSIKDFFEQNVVHNLPKMRGIKPDPEMLSKVGIMVLRVIKKELQILIDISESPNVDTKNNKRTNTTQ